MEDDELSRLRVIVAKQAEEISALQRTPAVDDAVVAASYPRLQRFCTAAVELGELDRLLAFGQRLCSVGASAGRSTSAPILEAWEANFEGCRGLLELPVALQAANSLLSGEAFEEDDAFLKAHNVISSLGAFCYGCLSPLVWFTSTAPELCERFRLDPDRYSQQFSRAWAFLSGLDVIAELCRIKTLLKQRRASTIEEARRINRSLVSAFLGVLDSCLALLSALRALGYRLYGPRTGTLITVLLLFLDVRHLHRLTCHDE